MNLVVATAPKQALNQPPIIDAISSMITVQPATPLTESRRRSSRLLGLKPSTPLELNNGEINSKLPLETQLARSGRKVVNQRRSDLIKWDDTPQKQSTAASKLDIMHEDNENANDSTTAKNTAINSNFDWLNSPLANVNKSTKKGNVNFVENKENVILDDVDDFLSFEDAAPIKIKRDSIAPKYLTPNFQRKSISNRVSLSANTNVINSPLLKIALISSQGKRLSTNMNANTSSLL